jgi:hypothetical protein
MSGQECRKAYEEWARTVPFTHAQLHHDCDAWIGWKAAWSHRKPEAKPLTVDDIRQIAGEKFTAHCPNALNGKLFEVGPILDIIAQAIHAAMPRMPSREEVDTIVRLPNPLDDWKSKTDAIMRLFGGAK